MQIDQGLAPSAAVQVSMVSFKSINTQDEDLDHLSRSRKVDSCEWVVRVCRRWQQLHQAAGLPRQPHHCWHQGWHHCTKSIGTGDHMRLQWLCNKSAMGQPVLCAMSVTLNVTARVHLHAQWQKGAWGSQPTAPTCQCICRHDANAPYPPTYAGL